MRWWAITALVALMPAVACNDASDLDPSSGAEPGPVSTRTVRGVVLEVNGGLETVESFVLRTDDGEVIDVMVTQEGDFRFPLAHLHDHRRTLEPLLVELDVSVDPALAIALQDANHPEWHTDSEPVSTTTTQAPTTTTTSTTKASSTTTTTTSTTQPEPEGALIELAIVDGSIEGGVRRETVSLNETVTIQVTGNSTDEIHIHGYDLYIDLEDGEGLLSFTASIPGIFEVELEGSHTLVLQLEVS
ncbi:MAG: hypothetical protein OXH10_08020 [bacterium]|nr:hypothetical protein [bacterium]MCY3579915.1 hypothetical protein [bacterium]